MLSDTAELDYSLFLRPPLDAPLNRRGKMKKKSVRREASDRRGACTVSVENRRIASPKQHEGLGN